MTSFYTYFQGKKEEEEPQKDKAIFIYPLIFINSAPRSSAVERPAVDKI